MAWVTDLRVHVLCVQLVAQGARFGQPRSVSGVDPRRARVARGLGAPVREAWLQHKRLPSVGREGLANRVDLSLHVGHRPRRHNFFEDPHMPRKEPARVRIQVRIRRRDGYLRGKQLDCQN